MATPADPAPGSPAEFRPYRRFVSLLLLTFISMAAAYLILSVAVTIYRQRHAIRSGSPIGAALSRDELRGCVGELGDVNVALEKHLEKSHYLLGGYDQGEAQRWASEGDIWRSQWRNLGERCRLNQPAPAGNPVFEELGAAYRDLGATAELYIKDLLRFGREQAPRLDRIRGRINRIGERLAEP